MKKVIIFWIWSSFLALNGWSQEIKSESQKLLFDAEKSYDKGNYNEAIELTKLIEKRLGNTNAVIQYIRVKAFFKIKQYDLAQAALMKFYDYPSSELMTKEINTITESIISLRKKILLKS